jgi:hypothetical protein
LIGPYVWSSADVYWKQQLAPAFLEAWRKSEDDDPLAESSAERGARAQSELARESKRAAGG